MPDFNSLLNGPALLRHVDGLLEQTVDEALVLIDVAKGECFGLENVSREIWLFLREPTTIKDICTALTEKFDADETTCETDVKTFLSQLYAQGLVEIARKG